MVNSCSGVVAFMFFVSYNHYKHPCILAIIIVLVLRQSNPCSACNSQMTSSSCWDLISLLHSIMTELLGGFGKGASMPATMQRSSQLDSYECSYSRSYYYRGMGIRGIILLVAIYLSWPATRPSLWRNSLFLQGWTATGVAPAIAIPRQRIYLLAS